MRLTYIENHDSNAWEGTQYENFGDALPAFVALSFAGEGLPMVHNGQEACNAKRLEFFEKDAIDWTKLQGCDVGSLIKELIEFRRANPVLANGAGGARMSAVLSDKPKQLFSWVREDKGNKVVGLFNLSAQPVTARLTDAHGGADPGIAITLPTADLPALAMEEGALETVLATLIENARQAGATELAITARAQDGTAEQKAQA